MKKFIVTLMLVLAVSLGSGLTINPAGVHASPPTVYTATWVTKSTTDSFVTMGNITITKGTTVSVDPITGSGPLVGCTVTETFTDVFNSETNMSNDKGTGIRHCGARGEVTYSWQGTIDWGADIGTGTSIVISGTGEFDGAHDTIFWTWVPSTKVTTLNSNFHAH